MLDEQPASTAGSRQDGASVRAPQSGLRPASVEDPPTDPGDVPAPEHIEPVARRPLANAWQVPLILLSTGLILGGFLVLGSRSKLVPDPSVMLGIAEQRIAEGRLDQARLALERAATSIEELGESRVPVEDHGRLRLGQADLESRRSRIPRNDQRVLSLYEQAQALGMTLSPEQEARRAAALAALGDHDAAFETFFSGSDGVDSPEADHIRRRVLGVLVERAEGGDSALRDQLVGHLDVYASGDAADVEDAAWAMVQAARLRLAAGAHDLGLERLMRSVRRLEARQDEPQAAVVMQDWYGRIQATFGRLRLAGGDQVAAREALEDALDRLPDGDEDRLLAEASLARIDRREGHFEEAIGRFRSILARHPSSEARMEVYLARAETYAANGDHELAVADYREAIQLIETPTHPMVNRVADSISDRIQEEVLLDRPGQAIRYGGLVLNSNRLPVSDQVLRLSAKAHRLQGESMLHSQTGLDADQLLDSELPGLDPAIRKEAARQFRQAGSLYESLALRLHERNEPRSGWSTVQDAAAACFDLGADRVRALHAYTTYLAGTGVDDGARAEVALRHARALHSDMRFSEALAAYDSLVELHGRGLFSAKARVAGAACLVAMDRPREAQARLELIVSGTDGIRPEAPEFQDAIFALGRLLHESELHAPATRRLDEAIRRYPDDPRRRESAFMLGASLEALAADQRARELDRSLTPSVRDAARREWAELTERAMRAFDLVIESHGQAPIEELSPEGFAMLRDARVGRANGLLDLGRFRESIDLYEQIERIYRTETTSLDALIRLNEAWTALGRTDEAEKAHSRAVLRLRQLPEEVFDRSRFDRPGWTAWLERRPMRVAADEVLGGGIVQGSEGDDG